MLLEFNGGHVQLPRVWVVLFPSLPLSVGAVSVSADTNFLHGSLTFQYNLGEPFDHSTDTHKPHTISCDMAAHQSVGLFFVRRHCFLEMEAFIIEHQVTTSSFPLRTQLPFFPSFFLRNSNKTETDFQKQKTIQFISFVRSPLLSNQFKSENMSTVVLQAKRLDQPGVKASTSPSCPFPPRVQLTPAGLC